MAKKKRAAVRRAAAGKKKRPITRAEKKATRASRRSARPTRKTAVQKPSQARAVARAAAGPCIDLISAGEIIQDVIPGGPHDIDTTLENAGLITAAQRTIFRTDVVNKVSERGCTIDAEDVPNSSSTTLRDARTAVQQNAH